MSDTNQEKIQAEAPAGIGEQEPLVRIDPSNATPEQVEELKQRAIKADENWDRLLRTTADFDNYKKRAVREKQEAIKFSNEGLLTKLMPVLDSFDMAVSSAQNSPAGPGSAESLLTGVKMIFQQMKSVLAEAGLEEVDALGQAFDPNLHEAVAQHENAQVPEGQVIQQLRKGYKLKERLLRPATVIIAKQPASA